MANYMKSILITGVVLTGGIIFTNGNGSMAFLAEKLTAVKSLVLGEVETPPAKAPTKAENNSILELAKLMPGQIVFDSNRSGSFGIYSLNLSNQKQQEIYNSAEQDIYPDVSPDGQTLVFAKAKTLDRDADSEIWLVGINGENPRKIADGTFPTFSSDGSTVYFEVKRSRVMAINIDGSGEKLIFPRSDNEFAGKKVVKPRISSDGKNLLFTSDRGGRWTAWSVNLENLEAKKVGKGCEPTHFNKSKEVAWVTKKNVLAGSAIGSFNIETGEQEILHDRGEVYGHEYFPTIEKSDKFLLYSACPNGQHSHYEANYQIFVRDLSSDKTVRLTFDEHTNRWPKYVAGS